MAEALDVWMGERLVGRLERSSGRKRIRMQFAYDPAHVARGGAPISRSMPVRELPYDDDDCHVYFAGLLPEGEARSAVARLLGADEGNDWRLLMELGGEVAGALSLMPEGQQPIADRADAEPRWLGSAELAELVRTLPRRPFLIDEHGNVRMSLAGVQDKLPVVWNGERVGLPAPGAPSTHIMKLPIPGARASVANEWFCQTTAGHCGIDAAKVERLALEQRNELDANEVLLVRRFDRDRAADGAIVRLHQEDLCQALGYASGRKYESDGGPGFANCAAELRAATSVPARDVLALLDQVTFSYLVGNHDAHAKNYSLLHAEAGTRLAPMYDVLCTAIYADRARKQAMRIGGEYRADMVRARHWTRLAQDAGLAAPIARRRQLALADRVLDASSQLAAERETAFGTTTDETWMHSEVLKVIAQRAAWLARD